MTMHHGVKRQHAGVWQVARPMRDTSWWHRRKQERACRKTTGHCWHPEGIVDWWCCLCSGETDGMPEQRCVHCLAEPQECQGADFSKVSQHLSDNLVAHAKRDGLGPVATAVFLSRGGHAPGTACPTEGPPDAVHASSCSWLLGDDCDCGAEITERKSA